MPGGADMAVTPEIRRKRPELVRLAQLSGITGRSPRHAQPNLRNHRVCSRPGCLKEHSGKVENAGHGSARMEAELNELQTKRAGSRRIRLSYSAGRSSLISEL